MQHEANTAVKPHNKNIDIPTLRLMLIIIVPMMLHSVANTYEAVIISPLETAGGRGCVK